MGRGVTIITRVLLTYLFTYLVKSMCLGTCSENVIRQTHRLLYRERVIYIFKLWPVPRMPNRKAAAATETETETEHKT